jgi:hypothetical protein
MSACIPATSAHAKLDAIYIPTQRHRPPPGTRLEILFRHADQVTLLVSDDAPVWAENHTFGDLRIVSVKEMVLDPCFDKYPGSRNPSVQFGPHYDLPLKRTYALQAAREASHTRIGLLDDDILLDDQALMKARAAVGTVVDVASFHVLDYPDVSTVDHIERLITGTPSPVSIGGNCLFLSVPSVSSYFPRLYNDDWMFLYRHLGKRRIASLGSAGQRPYAPWETPGRVEFEQFGDMLIEGMKDNIRHERSPFSSSPASWHRFQVRYLRRLSELRSKAGGSRLSDPLDRAIRIAGSFLPDDFHEFITAYAEAGAQP